MNNTQPSAKQKHDTTKTWQDHLGNNYPSLRSMLKHYDITMATYYKYNKNMSFKEILEKAKRYNTKDHFGVEFTSEAKMCAAHGVNICTFRARRKKGMPLKDALVPRKKYVQDHLGNKYTNETAMCNAYKISHSNYLVRLKRHNWSLENTLTKPVEMLLKGRTGETKISKYGQKMTISEYRGYSDMDVTFEDGTIVKTNYKSFTNNSIRNPNLKIGETKISKYGQKMTITEYRGYDDLDVTFEDGTVVKTTYNYFTNHLIKNPNLKTGYIRPHIAYTLNDGTVALYYKCENCGLEDVGTWQQIVSHHCQKSDAQIGVLTNLPVNQYEHKNNTTKVRKQ